MKKKNYLFLLILLLGFSTLSIAQYESSEGGVPHTTAQIKESINNLPVMERRSFIAPDSIVDNSQQKFMRDIFNQKHESCAQASGVGYVFTYEINWLRNRASNSDSNLYPTHFTYNFLNEGDGDSSSTIFDGWEIIQENGCPNLVDYGGDICINSDPTNWMTGYTNYKKALSSQVDSMFVIDFRDDPEEGLAILKQWLFNHNNDTTSVGGLSSFVTNMGACYESVLVDGTPEAGKTIISNWFPQNASGMNHQLTIVGYNDSVRWDVNGNQNYSNTEDSNGDSIINMLDWEIGALKLANSRVDYADSGFVYWPYRLLADTALMDSVVYIAKVKDYEPELVLKANIYHENRSKLRLYVDYGEDAIDTTPEVGYNQYVAFAQTGGNNPILGDQNYEPLEVVLDFNRFFADEDVGKLYLNTRHLHSNTVGYLSSLALVDNRWGETFELNPGMEVDTFEIGNNWYSIDYDLIVLGDSQNIIQDDTLYSDMVCRFKPTVSNNSTLTIESGVTVDMYNSELIIEKGSTLVIEDSAIIHAKRGVSKIMVYGEIEIGTGVLFTADDSSGIELRFKNDSVSIDNCSFKNAYVYQTIGDLNISNSVFKKSSIIASDPSQGPTQNDNYVGIKNCSFDTAYIASNAMIEIYGYKSYEITGNDIHSLPYDFYHGISVHYSGSPDTAIKNEISNNKIHCSSVFYENKLSGVTIYSGYANITNNYIHTNGIGVQSLGNSQINITGNENAIIEDSTQRIINNIDCQVYASKYAFPVGMHWNAIYSGDSNNCFVYHDVETIYPIVNVKHNNWGPNFNPDSNLLPVRHYNYDSIWVFNGGTITYSAPQQLFETGLLQIADNNYTGAKTTFQQVVTDYPLEVPAQNSLKEILYLEPLAGNNFSGLKNWFLTEPVIQNNAQLSSLAENLANKCDEKLKNYPDAIDWYESIIENPESLEDSIFAIIDLEHLYWQMGIDTTLRSASYVGRLSQFKPKSFQSFKDHKDELLLLLHVKKSNGKGKQVIKNETDKLITNGKLLQNVPNPFSGTTKISYNLEIDSDVQLDFYTYTGQLIKTVYEGTKINGTHIFDFDASGLKSGVYFYSLKINGKITDSKKMVILK